MMNENNNSIVGNNVIRNNDNVKSAVKTSSKQHKPNISTEKATSSSPAFEFSDMESLRFSSDDDDDDENNILNSAAEDELEQHYENQIHHLQKKDNNYINFM